MSAKTSQLQIRVSPEEKQLIREAAERAGLSVSAYVLQTALPRPTDDLAAAVERIADHRTRQRALADLILSLATLPDRDFLAAVDSIDPGGYTAVVQNCLAAAVEHVCRDKGLPEPSWVAEIVPLPSPHFAWELRSLRPFLMRAALPSFKRRRLYIPAPAGVLWTPDV